MHTDPIFPIGATGRKWNAPSVVSGLAEENVTVVSAATPKSSLKKSGVPAVSRDQMLTMMLVPAAQPSEL